MKKLILYLIIFSSIIGGAALYPKLKFDFDVMNSTFLSPKTQEQLSKYQQQFEKDDDVISLILSNKKGWKNYEDFVVLSALADSLAILKMVNKVNSITNIELPQNNGFFIENKKLLSITSEEQFLFDFEKAGDYPDIFPKFLSKDPTYVCLYIYPKTSQQKELASSITKILNTFGLEDRHHFLGVHLVEEETEKTLQTETILLAVIGVILLLMSYWFIVGHLFSLLITLLLIAFNVSAMVVFMWGFSIPFSILLAAVPCVVAILTFSDLMHIFYQHDLLLKSKTEIKGNLFKSIEIPLMLTSATNLIGFAIFFVFWENIQIIHLVATATFGILFSYLSARLVVPTLIDSNSREISPNKITHVNDLLKRLTVFVTERKSVFWTVSIVVFIGMIFGTAKFSKIDMHYFDGNTRNKSSEGFAIYDNKFQGLRDIEVLLEIQDSNFYNSKTIAIVDSIENYLINTYGCKSTFSINTVVKRYNRFDKGGKTKAYKLPKNLSQSTIEKINQQANNLGVDKIISNDKKKMRIIGNINDIGCNAAHEKNIALQEFLNTLKTDKTNAYIFGKAFLFDESIFSLTTNILLGLVSTLLIIVLFVALFFKSIKIAFMLLMVNAMPLLSGAILIALFGQNLNPQTIFMLSILLGIALDDSIYLLYGIHKKIKGEVTNSNSLLKNAFPLFVTSIVLGSAFLSMCFSSFSSTALMGFVLFFNLIFAFFADVIMMPLLLKDKN